MARFTALLAVLCFITSTAGATAAEPVALKVKPFTLTTSPHARKPNVGVDSKGTGHFAWNLSNPQGDDPLVSCTVPRGVRVCQNTQNLHMPLEAFGEPQVLILPGDQVVLVAERCCGTGEGTYALVSNDGGATFAAPRLIGSVEPGQAVLWPGTDLVALSDDVITAGVHFQAGSLSGAPATAAALLGDGSSQDYDGTIGFPTATAPIVAFDDLHHAFWRAWSGSGDYNSAASWGQTQSLDTNLSQVRIATGPKGVVVMGARHSETPFYDQFVARRFDATTNTWGKRVALSNHKYEPDVIFRDTFEDPGGNVATAWVANGTFGKHSDPIRYRVSKDGGVKWLYERTLVGSTHDEGFNLQMGAAADGGGFLAWDNNDSPPLRAVPIPPVAAQGSGKPPTHHKHHH